jgi:hypothetical protein
MPPILSALAVEFPGPPMARLLLVVAVVSAALLPLMLTSIRRLVRTDRLVAEQCDHGALRAVIQATVAFTTTLLVLVATLAVALLVL